MAGPWDDYKAPEKSQAASGPWQDYSDSPAEVQKSQPKIMDRLDELARKQGYKDAADQSAQLGQGVMGGQIASMAGPAISKLMGRGAQETSPLLDAAAKDAGSATESVAAESPFQISQSGPIKNLQRPGAPILESTPAARAAAEAEAYTQAVRAMGLGGDAAQATGATVSKSAPVISESVKNGILKIAEQNPLVKAALGSGGISGAYLAIKHSPELAGAAVALGLASTPIGAAGENALVNQIGMDRRAQAEKNAPSKLEDLSGERKWTISGWQNVLAHDPGETFRSDETVTRAFESPKVKALLIQASGLQPGSQAMGRVVNQIKRELRGSK